MARSSPLLEAVLHKRLTALGRALPLAAEGDVEAIHQARVATRRLREALSPFADKGEAQRAVQREVRRITRLLGPVRELDVALGNLDELEAQGPGEAIRLVREVLSAERTSTQRAVRKDLSRIEVGKIRSRVLRLARRAGKASARDRLVDVAWKQVARRASKLKAEIERVADDYAPDRLHAVRIAAKKLRYALESVAGLTGARQPAGVSQLKQAQDLLGRMHDLQVLTGRARAAGESRQDPAEVPSADLERLTAMLEDECRELHAGYLAMHGTLLRVCERSLRAARRHKKGGR